MINIFAVLLMIGVVTFPFSPKPPVLMALAIVRTIVDYCDGRDFYFPKSPVAEPSKAAEQSA